MSDDDRSGARRIQEELTGQLPGFLRDLLAPSGDRETEEIFVDRDLSEDDLEVVEALVEFGLHREEAEVAVVEDRVPLAIAQFRRREKARYSLLELSERSGVPEQVMRDVYMAMGLPGKAAYTREDLQWARNLRRMLDVLSHDAVIRSARVRGTALAAVARSDIATIREELLLPMRQAGADELTMAVALAEAADALEEVAVQALSRVYELQLDHQLSTELVAMSTRSSREEVDIAVGFVDVEGYTALSARIDPGGLDAVIDAFEERVTRLTSDIPEVSPVKYLGDAVMLVSSSVVALAEVMLELTTPVDELADAPLRGGMAAGPVLVREGDFFGSPVNVAARLTDHARAWSLLADDELAAQLDPRFETRRVRPFRARGIGTRRPVAVVGQRGDGEAPRALAADEEE